MDRSLFDGLTAFAAIAERRSFARAAAHLGVTPSALSQTIKKLEDRLGVRLLHRTTRSVAPSAAGDKLLARLVPTLASLDSAVAEAQERPGTPSGTLRINLPKIAAELVVAPRLPAFTSAYPDVVVELVCEDRLVDIVAGRFDAGIRLGERLARDMVAVEIGGRQRLVVVGTPAYFARHGRPRQPRDLLAHRCVVNLMPGGEVYRWELERDGKELELAVTGPVATNDPRVAELAVLGGCGLGYAFESQVAGYVAAGQLETALTAWSPTFPGFHLYSPSRRQVTPALRAFIDVLRRR
ncbi:MAG TPA: LysR family transcriptional regulator [Kofleriaceae bacterium]|nr:LysR family transcriptional regulator [Kofleriaceae bacterium]